LSVGGFSQEKQMNSPTGFKSFLQAETTSADQDDVIRLENASVYYRVPQERIGTFKEYMIRRIQGKVRHNTFMALKDVNLNVYQGEVFGLIGQNGAGKSTLLKLVARVLSPSEGRVQVKGRVAPLLEIGAGFHPELTGRENVYLNGAILGLSREELDERFDQIVDFAELWDFIDAPLRTYSTGMWARLGFAVATDSRPEILIVDEVLSVGDTAFQFKCSKRIESYRAQGTTIMLVSHSMDLVEKMCDRAAWLDHGQIVEMGNTKLVVDKYLGRTSEQGQQEPKAPSSVALERRWGSQRVMITSVRLLDESSQPKSVFATGDKLVLEMEYSARQPVSSPIFGVAIHRRDGIHVTGPNTATAGFELGDVQGTGEVSFTIPDLPLLNGDYIFSVAVTDKMDSELYDYHDIAYPFQVINDPGTAENYGVVTLRGEWQHTPSSSDH
jgi:ABC-type polysaccharide/polyol phosphate transport system ATPase subunit